MFDDLMRGMTDDEWLEIVANGEREQSLSREIDSEENPDLDMISPAMKKSPTMHLNQTVRSTNEMRPMLESMNDEQQRVFYHVRHWCLRRLHDANIEPIRLFVTGGAGTGKSHLLKCLHYEATKIFCRKKHLQVDENIDVIHTLITAFTGAAAVNVDGVTIHSAFRISSRPDRFHEPLSCDKLSSYRCKLGSLKLLFIDEISLVPGGLWGAMHARLQQITGTNSNKSCFGNVGVIAIGDFYQCPPVGSSSVYTSMLWSDHFECVQLNINERQKANRGFSEMLNRIRKLRKNEAMNKNDREILEQCHQRYLNHEYNPQALYLFAKNADVDAHNDQMLERLCDDIRSFDTMNSNGKSLVRSREKMGKSSHVPLRLAIDARVMITKNISVIDGIANGVTGHIVRFIENGQEVSCIVIKCNSSHTGQLHRSSCKHCRGHDTICVVRENDNDDGQDKSSRSSTRKQFPLRLSWAMTVHKAQGLTVDELVLSTKDLFAPGMCYTGFSRQRNIEHLFLNDLHLSKIYCDPNVDDALSRMKCLNTKSNFPDDEQNLNVVYHNIEGLKCNIVALRNHYLLKKAHLILLAQTWIREETDETLTKLNGYQLIQRTRSVTFASDHPLKSGRHGGVAVYIRNDLSVREICPSVPLNLEHMLIESDEKSIALMVCYRSPQHKKREFQKNLVRLLDSIDRNKRIVIVGDINENSLDTERRTIDESLSQLGFINLVENVPTTESQTSLDCVYVNFVSAENDHVDVGGSFYSYHEPICMSFDVDKPLTKITRENRNDERIKWQSIDSAAQLPTPASLCAQTNSKRKRSEETKGDLKIKKPLTRPADCLEKHHEDERTTRVDYSTEYEPITNDTRKENALLLLQKLSILGLQQVKTLGDGNCFFRAVSDQLNKHERDHLKLRTAAVNHIAINRDYFSPFLTSDNNNNMEQYIRRMKRDGTYADHLAIKATSVVIRRNIVIHRYDDITSLVPSSEDTVAQIHVAYDRENRHYDSVRCLDGSVAQLLNSNIRILD